MYYGNSRVKGVGYRSQVEGLVSGVALGFILPPVLGSFCECFEGVCTVSGI